MDQRGLGLVIYNLRQGVLKLAWDYREEHSFSSREVMCSKCLGTPTYRESNRDPLVHDLAQGVWCFWNEL